MRQKFGKLSFVHICKNSTSYFYNDCDAIINGTYSQVYGGKDIKQYSVYIIEKGIVVDRAAWFDEQQLTLLPVQNKDNAEQMIEDYNFGSKA